MGCFDELSIDSGLHTSDLASAVELFGDGLVQPPCEHLLFVFQDPVSSVIPVFFRLIARIFALSIRYTSAGLFFTVEILIQVFGGGKAVQDNLLSNEAAGKNYVIDFERSVDSFPPSREVGLQRKGKDLELLPRSRFAGNLLES